MADASQVKSHRYKAALHQYALYESTKNRDFDVRHYGSHVGRFNLANDADLDPGTVLPADVRH